MNDYIRTVTACAAVLAAVSCAKQVSQSVNESNRLVFDAFVNRNFKEAVLDTTSLGAYVIADVPGTGDEVKDSSYLFIEYTYREMETGIYGASTSPDVARQLGTFSTVSYYGPTAVQFLKGQIWSGLYDVILGGRHTGRMKVGGERTGILPGWLTGTTVYSDANGYLNNVTGKNYIYEIKLCGQTKDIQKYQIDSIKNVIGRLGLKADSLAAGLYYVQTCPPLVNRSLKRDTTIYINYVGRLLNGKVFDTSIADTAKVWNMYSSQKSYGPVQITCSTDSTAFKMSSSSVITGFSRAIANMHPYESGLGIFTSDFGYKAQAQDAIPPYSPLMFEISIVDKK